MSEERLAELPLEALQAIAVGAVAEDSAEGVEEDGILLDEDYMSFAIEL